MKERKHPLKPEAFILSFILLINLVLVPAFAGVIASNPQPASQKSSSQESAQATKETQSPKEKQPKKTITEIPLKDFTVKTDSTKVSQDIPQDEGKIKPSRYIPGVVIIKFKEAASNLVDKKINTVTLRLSPLSTGLISIDNLNKKHKVISIIPLIRSLKTKQIKSQKTVQQLAEATQTKFKKRAARAPKGVKVPNLANIYKFELADKNADILAICKEYQKDSNVAYCEPDYIIEFQMIPNDTYADPDPDDDVWSTGSWGQSYPDLWGLKRIKADQAWNITQGSPEVIVAVLDSGVDYTGGEIAANIWVNPGEIANNGIDDDNNGYIDDVRWPVDPVDSTGHGSHIAGTIAAVTNNRAGYAGISWHSKIMAAKIGDGVNSTEAIYYATDNGADIFNMSWGTGGTSQALIDAMDYAYANGVVVVVAAGNDKTSADNLYPPAFPHVITVSALSPEDKRTDNSNWGNVVKLIAPGEDILSIGGRKTGTSMAAPHVCGVAALILSRAIEQGITLTPDLVEVILTSSAEDIFFPGKDARSGYGVLDAQAAVALVTPVFNQPFPEFEVRNGSALLNFPGSMNLDVNAEIFNRGRQNANNVPYEIYLGGPVGGILLYQGTISSIAAGASANVSQRLPVSLSDLSVLYLTFVVNPDNIISEYLSTNNQLKIYLNLSNLSGWPKTVVGRIYASPTVIDLDPAYPGLEVIVGSYDFNVYAWHADGTPVAGWPKSAEGKVDSSPAVADLDPAYPGLEVTVGSWRINYPGKVFAWHADGTPVAGWPKEAGRGVRSSPAIADISNDPAHPGLEVVISTDDNKIFVFHSDGTLVTGWPKTAGAAGYTYTMLSSPAVADIVENPSHPGPEIIIGSTDNKIYVFHSDGNIASGWPKDTGCPMLSTAAVGDISNDPAHLGMEIVAGGYDGKVYAWHADGTPVSGWPKVTNGPVYSSPVIVEISNDPVHPGPEIIVGSSDEKVYAWHADGTPVTGWPKVTDGAVIASAAVVDLDNDSKAEIVLAAWDGCLYVWRADSDSLIPLGRHNTEGVIISSPAITDLNNDGKAEIIVGNSDAELEVCSLPWDYDTVSASWPTFHFNFQRTGCNIISGAPVFNLIGNKTVDEGLTLNFTVSATDPNGDPLTYSVSSLPAGATFDAVSRTFNWTPGGTQSGNYPLTFSVTDGTYTDNEAITIKVNNVNHPPVLTPIPDKQVNEGQLLTFTVTATDPDNDPLTFSTSGTLPAGAAFDATTQIFSWTPSYTQGKTTSYNIIFRVSDGSRTDSQYAKIKVNNVNGPPAITPIGNKVVYVDNALNFQVSATDPDNDPLVFSAGSLPVGSSFNPATQVFNWTPTDSQIRTEPYPATFNVTDNINPSVSQTINISVRKKPSYTCFLKGTPILMANGKTKLIEKVRAGDTILAFDEVTKELKPDKVKQVFRHKTDEYLVINGNLRLTANHPVYSNGKWVEIGSLKVGDQLLNSDGQVVPITSITKVFHKTKVYNLEVNPYHTYVAGGIVVHNKLAPPPSVK